MTIQESIIDKVKRNRISTTEVADCLGKKGVVPGVFPLNRGHFRCGPVFWTYACNECNWEFHEQIRDFPEDCILLTETFNCNGKAVFGSLVSKFLMLYRQASAIVVMGKLRDIPHLLKENWPVWYEGGTPIGCYNRKSCEAMDTGLIEQRKAFYNGSIAVCDDSGVVVIPKEQHNQEFIEKLDHIEQQEDTWFDCIDRLKWDTFRTVCLKEYEDEEK